MNLLKYHTILVIFSFTVLKVCYHICLNSLFLNVDQSQTDEIGKLYKQRLPVYKEKSLTHFEMFSNMKEF